MKIQYILSALLCLCLLIAPAAAAGGAGTASNPYVIQTPAELQSIANDLSAYYVLGNDINMDRVSFTPIGSTAAPFFGSFDGQGYSISNLNINLPSTSNVGLFSVITEGATIKNLNFEDCTISGGTNTGTLYGTSVGISGVTSEFTIQDVDVMNCTITNSGGYCGGIGGANSYSEIGTVSFCDVSNCVINSNSNTVGGLIGYCCSSGAKVDVLNCTSMDNDIKASLGAHIGGLLGFGSYSTGSECYVKYCEVGNCHISAANRIGGVLGSGCLAGGYSEIEGNYVHDCVVESSTGNSIGGLLGYSSASTGSECYVNDNRVENCVMTADDSIGGLLGLGSTTDGLTVVDGNSVDGCTVKARTSYAGGVVGCYYATGLGSISGCTVSNTTIQAPSYAAGICPSFTRT